MTSYGRAGVTGLAAVSAALVLAVALAGAASEAPKRTLTIRVEARDYSFKLSRRSVPAGSLVRFMVRNRGGTIHDFVMKNKRTRVLRPGQSQSIAVAFPLRGTFRFLCSVSGHARLGMRGAFGVGKKPPAPAPPPPPVDSDVVTLARIGTFEGPVLVTAPQGDTRRLFVVEQGGTVRVVRGGEVLPAPFLDIRERIKPQSEGLLSIAFAPDYAASGLFYAFYNSTAGKGDIRISEFRRHSANPDRTAEGSERVLLTIAKPWENHNGGMLQFGPDGHLYASVGDGDSGVLNPPGFFAQRRDDLLGNILRIDARSGKPYKIPRDNPFVGLDGVRGEIWAYGLRNPWRFWIDHPTGSMLIGDAGNTRREEVNLASTTRAGLNFGWPCFEGSLPFDKTASCPNAVPPLLEYPAANGACAVIGGIVVRDPRLAALSGRYLYGDFCTGRITAVALKNGRATAADELGLVVPELTSFGVDGLRRVYVTSRRGEIYRLDPRA